MNAFYKKYNLNQQSSWKQRGVCIMKKLLFIGFVLSLMAGCNGCQKIKPTGTPNPAKESELKAHLNADLAQCGLKTLDMSDVKVYFNPEPFVSGTGSLANGNCIYDSKEISIRSNWPEYMAEWRMYLTFVHEIIHCKQGVSGHQDDRMNLLSTNVNNGVQDYFFLNHPKKCDYLKEYFN